MRLAHVRLISPSYPLFHQLMHTTPHLLGIRDETQWDSFHRLTTIKARRNLTTCPIITTSTITSSMLRFSHPTPKPMNPSQQIQRVLDYQQSYPCPICRHGEISNLTLMDAFACNFCHHIFTANLTQQTLHTADSPQPMAWRWTGHRWRFAQQGSAEITGLVWCIAMVLVMFPPAIVGLATYMLPATDGTANTFPMVWTGLTFTVHFVMVSWVLAEYHQLPTYITLKIWFQRLFR